MNNILRSITFTLLVIQSVVTANAEAESIKQQAEQRQDFTIPSPPSLDGIKSTPESSAVPTPPLPPFAVNGNIKIGSMPPPPLHFGINTKADVISPTLPECNAVKIGAMSFDDLMSTIRNSHLKDKKKAYGLKIDVETSIKIDLWSELNEKQNFKEWNTSVENVRKRTAFTDIKRKIGKGKAIDLTGIDDIDRLDAATFFKEPSLIKVNLPDTIKSIGSFCFALTSSLEQINIPKSLLSLGNSAFDGCIMLRDIELPAGIEKIGASAFRNCSKLSRVNFCKNLNLGNLREIPNECFHGCTSLTDINLPVFVTVLKDKAFRGCTGLTSISLPGFLNEISDRCFEGCSSLTEVSFPRGLKRIGNSAFSQCKELVKVKFNSSNVQIGDFCFDRCPNLNTIDVNGVEYKLNHHEGSVTNNIKKTLQRISKSTKKTK